jgi:tRNA(adenine34) deaminase
VEHDAFMRAAIEQARLGLDAGEVPIGAVLVIEDQVVARAFNQPIGAIDPTAHAEILVLRQAARAIGNYRLTTATVYVTLEPCLMCVGALVHARVGEVVYGAAEPKTGALVSTARLLDIPQLNHRFVVTGGVLETEARDLIQEFFRGKRKAGRAEPLVEADSRQV